MYLGGVEGSEQEYKLCVLGQYLIVPVRSITSLQFLQLGELYDKRRELRERGAILES